MMHPDAADVRTLTIVLPESQWQALRAAEPDAVGWLQDRIRERLAPSPTRTPGSAPEDAAWLTHDEY